MFTESVICNNTATQLKKAEEVFVIYKDTPIQSDLQFYTSCLDLDETLEELRHMEYDPSHPVVYFHHLVTNNSNLVVKTHNCHYDDNYQQYVIITSNIEERTYNNETNKEANL